VFGLDFAGSQHFTFFSSSGLLDFAFELFLGLTFGVALGEDGCSAEAVDGFVFHEVLGAVVAEAEAGGAVTSEGGFEAEEDDVLAVPSVFVGNQLAEIFLGDVGFAFVVDVEEEFLAG
jgi:hypothetical protein